MRFVILTPAEIEKSVFVGMVDIRGGTSLFLSLKFNVYYIL